MSGKKFVFTVAANVTSIVLYEVIKEVNHRINVEKEIEKDVKTTAKVEVKDPKDYLFAALAGLKEGVVYATVTLGTAQTAATVQKALNSALNKIDSQYIDNKKITATIVPTNRQTSGKEDVYNGGGQFNAPMIDTFGVVMQNLNTKAGAMYAHLFKGFVSDNDDAQHVAWRISDYPIVGTTAKATTTWSIQYAMCCGQVNDSGTFFQVTDYIECDLGDKGTIGKEKGGNVVITVDGKGKDGAITVTVPEDFDNGWYVGFGIVVDGAMHPTGIVDAVDGLVTAFTPKNDYSVNFGKNEADMGVYTEQQYSLMGHFDFTGTSDHYALCKFLANGKWEITTSSKPPHLQSGEVVTGSSEVPVTLPSDRIKSLHVEYYPQFVQ